MRSRAWAAALPILIALALASPPTWAGEPGASGFATGSLAPKVQIVVFSDFQCPFCGRAAPTLARVLRTYPDVQVVFRHSPSRAHKRALDAAYAAVAAGEQGELWPMHDALFAHQRDLSERALLGLARALGLDLARFNAQRKSERVRALVEDDRALAAALELGGTPSFFINGEHLSGAKPFKAFAKIIDAELAAAAGVEPIGVAWVAARTQANNPALYAFTFGGEAPPPLWTRRVGSTIYRVPVGPRDATRGPADALVTLVLFSDFYCPHCADLAPTLEALLRKYGPALRVVFKHTPMFDDDGTYPISERCVCARAQGRFWELHDLLFAKEYGLSGEAFERYAATAGLDRRELARCLEDPRTRATVRADIALAAALDLHGTPHAFVNGRKLSGARPLAEFEGLIDVELAKAKALVATGIEPAALYARIIEGGVSPGVDAGAPKTTR